MTKQTKNLVLAIEAAVSGGSISLISSGTEVAKWIGTTGMARAENLLADIDRLLDENGRTVRDIDIVAVSAGPGSFTGIRIGYSTALGLTTGLGIEMASESALKAMAHQFPGHKSITTAVPTGRDAVGFQEFDTKSGIAVEISALETQLEGDLIARVSVTENTRFVLHTDLFGKIPDANNCIDFGRNIAFAIGIVCGSGDLPRTEPLFISKSF